MTLKLPQLKQASTVAFRTNVIPLRTPCYWLPLNLSRLRNFNLAMLSSEGCFSLTSLLSG